jgi:hypothetical protein
LYVTFKVIQELADDDEDMAELFAVGMPVIALAALVVVANSLAARLTEMQPVLEQLI